MEPGDWIALAGIAAGVVVTLGVLIITRLFDDAREGRMHRRSAYIELVKMTKDMPMYAAEAFRSVDPDTAIAVQRRRNAATLAEVEIVASEEVTKLTKAFIEAINQANVTEEVKKLGGGNKTGPLNKEIDLVQQVYNAQFGPTINALLAQVKSELEPRNSTWSRRRTLILLGVALALAGGVLMVRDLT